MAWYIQSDEREGPTTKNTLSKEDYIVQLQQRNQKLYRELITTRPDLQQILKDSLLETKKLRMEKLTGKGKKSKKGKSSAQKYAKYAIKTSNCENKGAQMQDIEMHY